MKSVVKSNAGLTVEVRNLVTVAYQNDIGSRRRPIEKKEESKGHEATIKVIRA